MGSSSLWRTPSSDRTVRISNNDPVPDRIHQGLITLSTGPLQEPSKTNAIFDLDVFKEIHLSLDQFRIDPLFEKLREIKDDLFEAGLTETLKREFE